MEDRRFDELTRSLGSATSRRTVLKGLLGGLAASLVGWSRGDSAAAAPFVKGGTSTCPNSQIVEQCRQKAATERDTARGKCLADFGKSMGQSTTGQDRLEAAGVLTGCLSEAEILYHYAIENCTQSLIPCGNTCCDPTQCQRCVDGTCQSCPAPQECINRTCLCPNVPGYISTELCGDQCCNRRQCGECQDGTCVSYCEGEQNVCDSATGECHCPAGQTDCGDTCCGPDERCAWLTGTCYPACEDPCQHWDETTQSCQPNECGDICQQCQNGNCVPLPDGTECGSNLACKDGICGGGCPPEQVCVDLCCDPGTGCQIDAGGQRVCCPIDPDTGLPAVAKPGGVCCAAGEDVVACNYPDGTITYTCCSGPRQGQNVCHCCTPECCDNVTCVAHLL